MTDIVSKEVRSKMMSGIRGKNTKPEIQVRSLLHKMGYRFRLHRKDLPGKPDIVLPKYKVVVFVHGCFWHRHSGCRYAYTPKSHIAFWEEKFRKNIERDNDAQTKLENLNWKVLTVWGCETSAVPALMAKLELFLTGYSTSREDFVPIASQLTGGNLEIYSQST
jgi:DNA mismatch endonuclease (patch repair protein)